MTRDDANITSPQTSVSMEQIVELEEVDALCLQTVATDEQLIEFGLSHYQQRPLGTKKILFSTTRHVVSNYFSKTKEFVIVLPQFCTEISRAFVLFTFITFIVLFGVYFSSFAHVAITFLQWVHNMGVMGGFIYILAIAMANVIFIPGTAPLPKAVQFNLVRVLIASILTNKKKNNNSNANNAGCGLHVWPLLWLCHSMGWLCSW